MEAANERRFYKIAAPKFKNIRKDNVTSLAESLKNICKGGHFHKVGCLQSATLQKMEFFTGILPGFGVHFRSSYFKEHPRMAASESINLIYV